MPLDEEHFGKRAKTHLSGLDILENRWLLSAVVDAGGPPSSAVIETVRGIEATAGHPQVDYSSSSSVGSSGNPVPRADIANAAPSLTPALNGAPAASVTPPLSVSSPAITIANDGGSGTGQANVGADSTAPTTGSIPFSFNAGALTAAVRTPSAIPWGGRTAPIVLGAFKRARNFPISWSLPSEDPSATTTADDRIRQTPSHASGEGLDDSDITDAADGALIPQSDDETDFFTEAVSARTVAVNVDIHQSVTAVQQFAPYSRRNHEQTVPNCIAQDLLPSSASLSAQHFPESPNVPLIVHPGRPADLLDRLVPFDRRELERSVDRVLARFNELEPGTALDSGDWWFAYPTVPAVALGIMALIQYHRRRPLSEDRYTKHGVASYTLGLPGHPRDWACDPR